ncbi:MaoC/PaaZ C-terminal domain-containing protein [Paraburkholderia fungorum]|jgi:acyl dehydratase|uniref:MaoC/PaaZ C-terminal domain-containing protein n=1 Tax=Paraburkholderia fungorum TaxID=134537 RepID=UPI0009DE771A|nr:MaoC/PaaZ C-terminal domain-containing protein [Paraburkholderia fungorum]MBU7436202.1 hypothetical protein [Paraburkholderia fungorum]
MISMQPVVIERASASLGCWDELTVGQRFTLGSTRITLSASLEFSRTFDPFSFHVDPEAAKESMFGSLIVSGLHTLSAVHALSIRGGFLVEPSVLCGAGIDEIRFLRPVCPDDTISVVAEVIDLKPPHPGRDFGIARAKYWVTNDRGVIVMTFIDNHVIKLRRAGLFSRREGQPVPPGANE